MPDDVKIIFDDYDQKVANCKAKVAEHQKVLSEGKPIDSRLKTAEARLGRAERTLKLKAETREQAKNEQDEANRKLADAVDNEAKAQELVDDIRHEIGALRRQSATQYDGKPTDADDLALPKIAADALKTALNSISAGKMADVCAENQLQQEKFVEAINKLLKASEEAQAKPPTKDSGAAASSQGASAKPPKAKSPDDDDAVEVANSDEYMELDDAIDFDFEKMDLQKDLPGLIEQGFKACEDEEPSATRIRLKVWAGNLGEACRKQDTVLRKRMGPLNKFRKDPKAIT